MTGSCRLTGEEDKLFLVKVEGAAALLSEAESASASRSQPESSNTMSKEEEVQSLGPRKGQISKEWGVSEASGSAWLSLSDIRLSWPNRGWKDMSVSLTPNPSVLLDRRTCVSTDVSRLTPSGAAGRDTELVTGTFTDSTSMWSRKLKGQSVALKKIKKNVRTFLKTSL